ncbi:DUF1217 domain-containing protein [Chachezhania antarctica]|uniref:DUF1217 domain-containing protein n=1 Tax=Chachezhania antarctica TaxID=2340860 RepID=UPI000EB5D50D|nr:DUF1217 domain-containing protein [Chachezhania antarctica]|tara:strand:- start:292 stop:1095 length:804 start_codon:yes stop_codon:yes gene_type:complete
MSFQPVIPIGGIAGWRFLERTRESQFDTFTKGAQLERDSDYFAETIGKVTSAEDLIADRRLLNVALGAFGLQDDINNKAFIQKILEDGTEADDALANRLADERYKKLSEAFGFGPSGTVTTGDSAAMADIVDKYQVQEFETAVGNQNDSMRIAMYAEREVADIAIDDMSENAKWFTLLGQPPLKKFFETALGLPSAVGKLDLDRQLEIFKDKTLAVTGSSDVSQFTDPKVMEDLTMRYLARAQIEEFNANFNPAANALFLIQSANQF